MSIPDLFPTQSLFHHPSFLMEAIPQQKAEWLFCSGIRHEEYLLLLENPANEEELQDFIDDNRTCIIVVEQTAHDASRCGLVVDPVSEVMDIPSDYIEIPPRFGKSSDHSYLTGLGKMRDKVILLLEIDRVLGDAEVELFGDLQAPA